MKRFGVPHIILALLCMMYFVTYADRTNISSAASEIQAEFGFSYTQLGLIFSVFGYPYLLFQIVGGWLGDKFGARKTLFWCGIVWGMATILTGLAGGIVSLVLARLLVGAGEGATLPTATRAMQNWTAPAKRGFAQGITHSFARLGTASTPPLVALLMHYWGWRGSFFAMGAASLVWVIVWVVYFRNDPKEHHAIAEEDLNEIPPRLFADKVTVPWAPLLKRMSPVTFTYFCYGWCLWLYLTWLPLFFKNNYGFNISKSALFAAGVFMAGVVGDTVGGLLSDLVLRRTGNVRLARLGIIIPGFLGALISLFPILFVHDITIVALCLSSGFFFAELVIGPMWAVPMDIAPRYAGTAAGLLNCGSALAVIVSPLAAGYVIDLTHNWYLPFLLSMGLLLLGSITSTLMHPELPLEGIVQSRPFRRI